MTWHERVRGLMHKVQRPVARQPLFARPTANGDGMERRAEYQRFWEQGYVIVRGVFDHQEMQVLKQVITSNAQMTRHAEHVRQKSQDGKRPSFETIFVWSDTAGFDVFAKATRSYKILDRLEEFFTDEVYVYHNKVTLKYPGVVGFSYHQDYAYWYGMGNLYPDMAAVSIAIDESGRKNGCLKILAGSHKMGRLDHEQYDGLADSGVARERLSVLRERLPEVSVELEVGDIVIFHCNTLHGSDDNHSQESRIALLGCYNTKHNSPYKSESGHPPYHPQEKVYEKITEADAGQLPDFALSWSDT